MYKGYKKKTGTQGEMTAVAYLEEKGVRILEKNYRCRYGEIDLIGWDGEYYLVIEVKFRSGHVHGEPAEAVDYRKQSRICRTYDYYRMKKKLDDFTAVRFDVCEVDSYGRCHWLKNAFDYVGF